MDRDLRKITKLTRQIIGPLLLITCCPPIVMLVWYTNVFLNGSISQLFELFNRDGVFTTIYEIWSPFFFGTPQAWKILSIFTAIQLVLMKYLPG